MTAAKAPNGTAIPERSGQVSKNPSYNISCFDAFERSVEQTSRFVGMAIPVRNWNAFFNYQSESTSLKDELDHKWGKDAQTYIEDLVNRLQGGKSYETDAISGTADKLLSNYISATFGLNPSIVLKQAGSLPMAAAYLGWKNFPSVKKMRVDTELVSKYTKELQWRTMGYATPETKVLKENPGLMQTNKVLDFLTGGAITWADGGIAAMLWPWAENKVRSEQPDLEIGTIEQVESGESQFYKAVAKEFNDALSRSQSVSDETHQSSLRKSKNPVTRAFTMFRSDSAQAYNALRQKFGEAAFYSKFGAKGESARRAKQAVGAVVGSVVINAIWGELVDFVMAALKNGAKYYRDDEEELTGMSVGLEMLSGLFESFSGIVIGGDAIYEVIGSGFLGDTSFELEAPGMEQLGEIRDLAIGLGRNVKKFIAEATEVRKAGGNVGQYWTENADEIAGIVKDSAQKMATYFAGVPLANLEKYLGGIVFRISPALEQAYEGLFSNADKADVSNLTGNALRVKIAELLQERNISGSDNTAEVLSVLYESGYAEVIPSNISGSVSINGVARELDAGQKQLFSNAWAKIVKDALDGVVSSDRFAASSQNAQAKMISYLYGYAREMAKAELFDEYEPTTRADAVNAFADAGMDMGDFLYAYAHYNDIYNRDLSAGEKATAFAHWLDGESYSIEEKKVIKGELVFYNMSPAEANRYDSFVESGLSKDEAADLADDLAELVPEEGKTQVSDVQRWRTCVDFSTNEGVQLSALSSVMEPNQYAKVALAYQMGISPDVYVGYYEIRVKYDADKNGAYTQKEVKNAINAMGSYKLTQAQKAVLWQLITGSGSAKNNPYSSTIGQRVIDALEKAKSQGEETELSFQDEIMRQIMGG